MEGLDRFQAIVLGLGIGIMLFAAYYAGMQDGFRFSKVEIRVVDNTRQNET